MAAIGPASFLLPSLFRPFPSPFICSFRPSPPGFAHGPLFASPAYSFCFFALLVLRAPPFVSPVCAPVSLFLFLALFLPFPSLFSTFALLFSSLALRVCFFVRIGAVTVALLGDISKKGAVCNGWANDVWCGKGSHWRALRSDQALCEACLPGVKCACRKRRERATFLLHSALYLEKTGNSRTERRPNGRDERWREDARASES